MEIVDWKLVWEREQKKYIVEAIGKLGLIIPLKDVDLAACGIQRKYPTTLPSKEDILKAIKESLCKYCDKHAFHVELTECPKLGESYKEWLKTLTLLHPLISLESMEDLLEAGIGSYQKIKGYSSSSVFCMPYFTISWEPEYFQQDLKLVAKLLEKYTLKEIISKYREKVGEKEYQCGSYEGYRQSYTKFDMRYLYDHLTDSKTVPDPICDKFGHCQHCGKCAYHYDLKECTKIGDGLDEWIEKTHTKHPLFSKRQLLELVRDCFGSVEVQTAKDRSGKKIFKTLWKIEFMDEELGVLEELMLPPFSKPYGELLKLYYDKVGKTLIVYGQETGKPQHYFEHSMFHVRTFLSQK